MSRLDDYRAYHVESALCGDIDPSYAMLRYVCDRFELNTEQRYWLAFIYALTYCGASTFYIYNEFPDFENLDSGRLSRWWDAHRPDVLFQTDRRWVRSSNQFVPAVECYREWVGDATQHARFEEVVRGITAPNVRHDAVYAEASQLFSFGQFSLFLYMEALHVITPLKLEPTMLDLNVAHSCRNGLCYAYGYDQWVTKAEACTPPAGREAIEAAWHDVVKVLRAAVPETTVWQIETTLCAFKKFVRGDRYIGYYLDRQAVEIAKMSRFVPDGVGWEVLWQFRAETYEDRYRAELAYPVSALADGVPHRRQRAGYRETLRLLAAETEFELS